MATIKEKDGKYIIEYNVYADPFVLRARKEHLVEHFEKEIEKVEKDDDMNETIKAETLKVLKEVQAEFLQVVGE